MRVVRGLSVLIVMLALLATPMGAPVVFADVTCDDDSAASATAPEATPTTSVPQTRFPDGGGSLTLFAAASLTDAFDEMTSRLEADHPDLEVTVETAGSQTLVTQLQQGAQADVLATANQAWMETAADAGLITGDPTIFTGTRLVIVAPVDNPAGLDGVDDLAGEALSLILAGPEVPAGWYAQQALCDYAASGEAPEGFLDAINANLVSEETDVRSVLAKIQIGEADAGVIYASDAAAAMRSGTALTVIEFPTDVPVGAHYPIAALEEGDTALAEAFIAYVMSDEGQSILEEYGFSAKE